VLFRSAIEAYNKLLGLYPDDLYANNNFSMVYDALEEWDKAIERNEASIKYGDFTVFPPIWLAHEYMAKGQYKEARKAQERFIKTYGDNFVMCWDLSLINFCQGKYAHALLEVGKALTLNPDDNDSVVLRGYIYLCKGDLVAAEKDFEKLLVVEEKTYHIFGRYHLALLCLLQGKIAKAKDYLKLDIDEAKKLGTWDSKASVHGLLSYVNLRLENFEEALKECDEVQAIATEQEFPWAQRDSMFKRAMIFLEMNQIDKAQQAVTELRSMIEKQMNKKLIRMSDVLAGMVELRKNNFSQAIEYFNKAISLMPFQSAIISEHGLYLDCLAQAYYRSGALDKARNEYEKITSLTAGRTSWGDIYTQSFYMLGKIAEQQRDKAKAREHYQKFLDLWKDADPGLPEVEDARKRLAGLTGS
jgi:tetratricopeptide (TPR) repeat protein